MSDQPEPPRARTEDQTIAEAAQAALAERDAAIERLERALADEREKTATLRAASEGLQFKLEVLEKSYAKQLADSRERTAAVESELATERAKREAFQAEHDETLRSLAQAQRDLERAEAARQRRSRQAAAREPLRPQPIAASPPMDADAETGEGTINTLLGSATSRERRAAPDSHLEARVHVEQDAPAEEMLPPELVFTREEDDER